MATSFGHDVNVYPKRPGFGTKGKPIKLGLNSFGVSKFPTAKVHQYDVNVGNGTEKRALIRKIWNRPEVQSKFGQAQGSVLFDGNKLAWSIVELPFRDSIVIDVDLDSEDTRPRRTPRDNKFKVVIKKSSTVALQTVDAFVKGQYRLDNDVIVGITFLDHLMRETPSNKFLSIKRSFFEGKDSRVLSGGVEAWKGIFQSVRATQGGRLTLNVDVATSVFWSAGSVLDIVAKHLRCDSIDALVTKLEKSPTATRELRRFKKIGFTVGYRQLSKDKKFTIEAFTRDGADKTMFERRLKDSERTETVSVAKYFLEQYNIRLRYPRLPLIRTKKKNEMFPMELARVEPGQRYPFKLDERQTADMIKFTVTRPNERRAHIMKNVASLDWANDPILRRYGLTIDPNMIQTMARVLPAPKVVYGQGSQKNNFQPIDGRWDLRGLKFVKPTVIKNWGIMVFARQRECDTACLQQFVRQFCSTWVAHGGVVENPKPHIMYANTMQVDVNCNELYRATGNAFNSRPQILFFILQQKSAQPYNDIKSFCDTKIGMVSQCLQSRHVQQAKPQYCSNVAMKVNAKLGGSNHWISPADTPFGKGSKPTILIGADVSHAAPGSEKPSFASMVGSMDLPGTRFSAICNTNGQRVETIHTANMIKFIVRLLRSYRFHTNAIPERIMYFRDGVSEGQYAQIIAEELRDLKAACKTLQDTYNPLVTVTICSKRHHHRFFPTPQDRDAADRNGNVKAGTLVERDITHPTEYDFYLNAHSAIQGTARPVHYHVIHDENELSVDDFQRLVYNTSYTYIRATCSVSIIPTVYYAHLASNRARCHEIPELTKDKTTSEAPSVAPQKPAQNSPEGSGSTSSSSDENKVLDIVPLNPNLAAEMWFI